MFSPNKLYSIMDASPQGVRHLPASSTRGPRIRGNSDHICRPSLASRSLRQANASQTAEAEALPALPPEEDVPDPSGPCSPARDQVDPLYLFACRVEWESRGNTAAAWDLLAAAKSSHDDTRAHARALLASSRALAGIGPRGGSGSSHSAQSSGLEADMKGPYGLEIAERCADCSGRAPGFFCNFSRDVRDALDPLCQRTTLPAGAVLFVEGQMPRGMFIVCAGNVKLSKASKEGRVLYLKTAEAGEALGLSAAISGMRYEMTAETATPCVVSFVDRNGVLSLLENHHEVSVHASRCLSLEFHSAYRGLHELVLSRSSAGRLARLLLSHAPVPTRDEMPENDEIRLRVPMTHEEMAQRIGTSRETVTRLLSNLRKRKLIRLDGATLVIRDRSGLEALAI